MRAFLAALILSAAVPALAAEPPSQAGLSTRRVMISLSFSGETVFLYGQAPAGTERIVAVMEGPSAGPTRLMRKGRVALFWLGVRQYQLEGVPGLYQVNVNCPECNGMAGCEHEFDLAAWNRRFSELGFRIGPPAIAARASLEVLNGEPEAGELGTVVDGFWELERDRGLYGLRCNAIRLSANGVFYHTFTVPTQAPEGKYHITTYFLDSAHVLAGIEENELFVRKTGFVAWLSRLAERRAATYGIFTVLIAVGAGWLAGAVFKKGGGH